MSPPEIEPATLGFPAGHLDHLAIGIVVQVSLKLFQNPIMITHENLFIYI